MSERHGETIVITHHYADLDALASMVGAARLYGGTPAKGRAIHPMVRNYLALHKDHFPLVPYDQIDPELVERVIVVDVRDQRRLSEYEPIFERDPEIIVYDHHPATPHDLASQQTYVEPTGSCATMMVERLRQGSSELGMTTAEATLLLLG
ncbi:MAG: DHH family phosphoesterase, partial [Myxococcota bacterium]